MPLSRRSSIRAFARSMHRAHRRAAIGTSNGWPDNLWQWVRDSGGTVNVCPRSDPQYGLGEGIPAFQKALDHAMRPAFSIDNETSYGTDMFTEMRVAFNIQRAMATNRRSSG